MKLLTSSSSYTGWTALPTCTVASNSYRFNDILLFYVSTDSLSPQTPILLWLSFLRRYDLTTYLTDLTFCFYSLFYIHDTLLIVSYSAHTSPYSYTHYLHRSLSLLHEATYLSVSNRAHSPQYILHYVSSHYYYLSLHELSFQSNNCFTSLCYASQGHALYSYSLYYSKQLVLLHLLLFLLL